MLGGLGGYPIPTRWCGVLRGMRESMSMGKPFADRSTNRRCWRGLRTMLAAALLIVSPRALAAQELVPGDTVHLRAMDRVAGRRHRSTRIRMLVIAPVARGGGRVVVSPGSIVTGRVTGRGKERFEGKRHWLSLALDSIAIPVDVATGDTIRSQLSLRIVSVDDSRESIDSAGRVVGPPIPSIVRSKRDWAILLLGVFHPVG